MVGFLDKYKLVAVTLKPGVSGKSIEERCRAKMLRMVALQKSGKAKRNWFRTDGAGVTVFVPRYANVPLATTLGKGRGKGKRNAWAVRTNEKATLRDFERAVAKGDFDAALVEIASVRSAALSGKRRKRRRAA